MRRRELVSDGILEQRLDTLKKTQVDSALPYVVMQGIYFFSSHLERTLVLTFPGNTTKILEQRQRIAETVQEKQLEKSINKSKST